MSAVEANVQSAQYVDFWNEILVPKFIKYKHILVDGLTHHSEAIFPSLPVKQGDRVLDIGCGFGDTAIKLARRVGPNGKVIGQDCCEAFLEYGRKDAAKLGLQNVSFVYGDALLDHFEPEYDFVAPDGVRHILRVVEDAGLIAQADLSRLKCRLRASGFRADASLLR